MQPEFIPITLKAKHFGFINAFTPDKGRAEVVKLFTQVAAQMQTHIFEAPEGATPEELAGLPIGREVVTDPEQQITVSVKSELVPSFFLTMGSQQERLATNYNNEIRDALIPQVMEHPEVLSALQSIMQQNWRDTDQLVQAGFNYLITIKP